MEHYVPPHLTELGSVRELTQQQQFNKVGTSPDTFTTVTNGIVIGSLVTPN